jgi:hypothetical protein
MSDFGKSPAFPMPAVYDASREQVNSAYQYGCELGLNIQQHAWLAIYAAALADSGMTYKAAATLADEALPMALARLEGLS